MEPSYRKRAIPQWLALSVLVFASCGDDPGQVFYERGETRGFTEIELRGEELYFRYCSGCHGAEGDGNGAAAVFLNPQPRNFTRGVYKFRSTPSSSLPTDADLLRTLREGVHGTSMPSWRQLPEDQLTSLIAYLKTYSPRFAREKPEPSLALPGHPANLGSTSSVENGQKIYESLKCGQCHGAGGKGDGPSAATLTDSFDMPIKPFDFTRKAPKGGARPEDLYRTFMTGLAGTPMPSYAASIPDEQDRWDLVSFILSLRESGGDS